MGSSHRGPTVCRDGRCLCKPGFCADNAAGICTVPASSMTPTKCWVPCKYIRLYGRTEFGGKRYCSGYGGGCPGGCCSLDLSVFSHSSSAYQGSGHVMEDVERRAFVKKVVP